MSRVTFTEDEKVLASRGGLALLEMPKHQKILIKNISSLQRSYEMAVREVDPSRLRSVYFQEIPDKRVCFYFLRSDSEEGAIFDIQKLYESLSAVQVKFAPTTIKNQVNGKAGLAPGDLDVLFAEKEKKDDSGSFDLFSGRGDDDRSGREDIADVSEVDDYDDDESTSALENTGDSSSGAGSWILRTRADEDAWRGSAVFKSGNKIVIGRRSKNSRDSGNYYYLGTKTSASRKHATVDLRDGQLFVKDEGSSNKTRIPALNNEQVKSNWVSVPIHGNRAELRLGQVEVIFEYMNNS